MVNTSSPPVTIGPFDYGTLQDVIQASLLPIANSPKITPPPLPRISYHCTILHPRHPSNPTMAVTHTPFHRLRSISPRPRCFLRVTRLSSLRTLLHGNSVGGLQVTTSVGLIQQPVRRAPKPFWVAVTMGRWGYGTDVVERTVQSCIGRGEGKIEFVLIIAK